MPYPTGSDTGGNPTIIASDVGIITLPAELTFVILGYVSIPELSKTMKVSKWFRELAIPGMDREKKLRADLSADLLKFRR